MTYRRMNAVKNFILIYAAFALVFLTLLSSGNMIQIASAGTYNGPVYYVNGTSGNDANNGSLAYPWKTIQYGINHVYAGNTLSIMAGIYYNQEITTWSAHSGTSTNWVTYTSYQHDKVIIDAIGGTYDWGGVLWIDALKFIRVSNLIIRNAPSHGIYVESGSGACNNITIDNCTIYDSSEAGICCMSGSTRICDVRIENNTLYNNENGWNDALPSQETISLTNAKRFTIKNNVMYNNRKINIDAKAGCSLGYIHHNSINTSAPFVAGWASSGIYIDAGNTNCNNISIYDNREWGNNTGYIVGTEQGGTLNDIKIFNNIYNGTGHAFQINDFTSVSGSHLKTNLMYINNVVGHSSICFQITDKNTSFKNLTIRNCIFNGSIGFNLPGGLKLGYHHVDHNLYHLSSYSNYYGSSSINGSPCFVDPAHGDFSLLSNSPAIDFGSSNNAPPVDFNGIGRPQGPAFDIGAFEFSSGSDTSPPTISSLLMATSNPLDTSSSYGWANVSCTVTDNVGISQVWLKINNPDHSWNNVSMISRTPGKYYYWTATAFSMVGNYSYTVCAKDTNNNSVTSSNLSFWMPPNWDIDGNGVVSILDIVLVSNQYGSTGGNGWIRQDVDNNGVVNVLDIGLVSNHYG